MALRVSPERVRDVRFAEQWRGYRTDEVDEFVEQVAEAFDQLEARLEEAAERTALAERRLDERGPDEDLRRTLVLAQRTADAALEEARAEATRLVAEAEERAHSILEDLERRKDRLEGEIEVRIQAELAEVSERRAVLESDVELLASYVTRHRGHLIEELRSQLEWLEQAGHLDPLPDRPLPDRPPPPVPVSSGPPPASYVADVVADTSGSPADAPPVDGSTPDETAAGVAPPGGVEGDEVAVTHSGPDGSEDLASTTSEPEDDTVLDDLDVIPWASGGGEGVAAVDDDRDDRDDDDDDDDDDDGDDDDHGPDDDPFIAELRRAVDDPEPLGPRDDPGDWDDDVDLYDRHRAGGMRSRRRRRS